MVLFVVNSVKLHLTAFYLFFWHSSVHVKVDEKITLIAGRDGGLQNMEVRGLVLLRIADAQFGKIRLSVENNDDRGFQMQVSKLEIINPTLYMSLVLLLLYIVLLLPY